MYLDTSLKCEILSTILGQIIKPHNENNHLEKSLLSLDDFFLGAITGKLNSYLNEFFINEEEFFDPVYDFDFTNLSDSAVCIRGYETYMRPKGWYRMALKVRGKYPDGDTWLGTNGWRSHSVSGEWPVSYHGTSLDGAKGIIRSHYKAGDRQAYGRGIYSAPALHDAEAYAKIFKSNKTGKTYKVILQNRINPLMRKVVLNYPNYWLIPVQEGTSAEEEKRITEKSIRPYGVLVKEIPG